MITKRIQKFFWFSVLVIFSLSALPFCSRSSAADSGQKRQQTVQLQIFGKLIDSHNTGIGEAAVEVFLDGKKLAVPENDTAKVFVSGNDGSYQLRFSIPQGSIKQGSELKISAHKTGYLIKEYRFNTSDLNRVGNELMVMADIKLKRTVGPAFWIAAIIFAVTYILISTEMLHRTMAAMLGASLMLTISYTVGSLYPDYRIISYETAIKAVDLNVILLLMGMMIIIGILKHTGIFQWCAYKCFQIARGRIVLLAIILMGLTACSSAFLDNVTTMLLLTPVTIEIAGVLGIAPLAFLLPEIMASNIGGTATLIGDPPNIMIGSFASLSFLDFVINLAPVCAAVLILLFVYTRLVFNREFRSAEIDNIDSFIEDLRHKYQITDSFLLTAGILVLVIVVFLFLTHGLWQMEVSVAALFGASLLFLFGISTNKVEVSKIIEKEIEWSTLLFFLFLFILVGGVKETGLLDLVSDWVLAISEGNLIVAICFILWVSAIMSAFVDNIPFIATMLPVVAYLSQSIPGAENGVLWWALALGGCFGGNGTIIGASANVVTLGIAESKGYRTSFWTYMKIAFPLMVLSVSAANIWLLLMY